MMNPNTSNSDLAKSVQIAEFRFALIAPVIQGLFPDASRAEYYRRITEKPFTLPDGSIVKYKPKTIEKWASNYHRMGFDGLLPKERSDKGSTRVLPDVAIERIYQLKKDYPRLNATQIHAKLIEEGMIPATVSVCAVQRFVKRNDLKGARNLNIRDRKAFEEEAFGRMWQADTCYFPHITEDGKSRRVYAVCIIDDHSRMIVGAELFYSDSAAGFQKVLKDAVSTYGIPSKLLVDNGSPYANEQLSLICGSLGVALIHTRVRDGASKGSRRGSGERPKNSSFMGWIWIRYTPLTSSTVSSVIISGNTISHSTPALAVPLLTVTRPLLTRHGRYLPPIGSMSAS